MSRQHFTIEEQFGIICRVDSGDSASSLAREFRTSRSTISGMMKRREKIIARFNKCDKGKRVRSSNHIEIENALLDWFKQQRANNVPVSGPMLQVKAEEFAVILNKDSFKCNASWIQRFRSRHNIVHGKISGESAVVDRSITNDWVENVWPKLRAGYGDEAIFNADEMGLFFRLTPDRSLKFKGEKCSGGKLSKERVTVLVAANMTGSIKRKLLVIGKSKMPRCFKNIKNLPVDYDFNKKAWMTSTIFEKTLINWDSELLKQNKHIILIVDNCPSHPPVDRLKQIKLVFLPPNCTSVLQPMDQGVIRSLKVSFRKELVYKIIEKNENNDDTKVSILDAILMVSKAWESVRKETIVNCFRVSGLTKVAQPGTSYEDITDTNLQDAVSLLSSNCSADDYVQVDDEIITCEELSDIDIALSHQSTESSAVEEHNSNDASEGSEDFGKIPTVAEAYAACSTMRAFVQTTETSQNVKECLSAVSTSIEKMFFAEVRARRQTKITDFFP